ncbi:bioflim formation protein [Thermus scotoductus]|uniref:Bioflim formation protein n=1 Tax=Thermus scotoductus TaxID=37636 RepID=A0A430S4R8_THESC|nr:MULTISPECIES: bioflim formation protein [Thermus]QWK23038.1 MAG: bioflim formation protein [Thermus antranikianii]RTG94959.1 bioflim formation protein [Thermus scotoductus]RTH05793.1 bioflim formation protein [Thermus scotoductus]RTH08551.1 bioflim formation protein [Thermus scotoductus]RTH09884.1 bioflim formation protein [Thermus scotoductus]
MKRLVALSLLALSLALAQMPAYPENTLGLGYAPDKGVYLQGSALLPFSPLGIDTGLDVQALLSQNPEVFALFKANLFPGLVLADLYTSVGLGLDLRYPFGAHLGPVVSLEVPGGALSAYGGLGYQSGFHLAWGAGFRLYLEPLALEVSASDRYPFLLSFLYLW